MAYYWRNWLFQKTMNVYNNKNISIEAKLHFMTVIGSEILYASELFITKKLTESKYERTNKQRQKSRSTDRDGRVIPNLIKNREKSEETGENG